MTNSLPTLRDELTKTQLRISGVAVLLAVVTGLIAGLTTMGVYARTNLNLIAQTASYSVAPAIVFGDRDAVRTSIAPLVSTPGVASIVVRDESGRPVVILQNPRSSAAGPMSRLVERVFLSKPQSAVVDFQGRRIGTVHVSGRGDLLARYIWMGLGAGAACLLPAILATMLFARRLQANIIGPLRSIADVAHDVRANRSFGRRAEPASIEEIEGFRTDFNALIGELEAWQRHLKSENEALSHQATHDPLTGLPNRSHFETRLEEKLDEARRGQQKLAVFYADGNGFKQINDRFGHAVGDGVLVELSRRLRAAFRSTDIVARLGGDEFGMLLGPPFDMDGVSHVHAIVADAMSSPFALPTGVLVPVSISLGFAIYPDDGETIRELMHKADINMYASKTDDRPLGDGKGEN